MRKRAPVHSFDVALGLVWLVIIFCGLLYLLKWDAGVQPAMTETDPSFDDRIQVLGTLDGGIDVPPESERLRILAELENTSITDDRASVYPGSEPEISLEDRLQTLQALRTAR